MVQRFSRANKPRPQKLANFINRLSTLHTTKHHSYKHIALWNCCSFQYAQLYIYLPGRYLAMSAQRLPNFSCSCTNRTFSSCVHDDLFSSGFRQFIHLQNQRKTSTVENVDLKRDKLRLWKLRQILIYVLVWLKKSNLVKTEATILQNSCLVAQWLGRWIRDRELASSTPGGCVSE